MAPITENSMLPGGDYTFEFDYNISAIDVDYSSSLLSHNVFIEIYGDFAPGSAPEIYWYAWSSSEYRWEDPISPWVEYYSVIINGDPNSSSRNGNLSPVQNTVQRPAAYAQNTESDVSLDDPVDPATGDYLIDQSWLKLYGPNPLELKLFYKTGRMSEDLGNSYQATLAEDTNNTGSLSINWPGRATTIYRQTSTTSPYYSTNPDEPYDQVQSLGGGLYALIKRDQSQYTFQDSSNSGTAQLVQITRPQGQKTTVTYSGNKQTVTDTITGQQVQISYNNGQMISASDPLGRTLSLAYD